MPKGMHHFLLILFLISIACHASGCGGSGSGNVVPGIAPVVQIPFQVDSAANLGVILGKLSGAVEFTNYFDQYAYDPDGGDIAAYSWDFGDGGTSTEAKPTHTYTASGKYEVLLTVTDDEGGTCTAKMTNVAVSPAGDNYPAVRIKADYLNGWIMTNQSGEVISGFTVNFTALAEDPDGGGLTYLWDFGDGATSTEQAPAHTYTTSGALKPKVTVTNDLGKSSEAYICIFIISYMEENGIGGGGTEDSFKVECTPNPGSFLHGTDTTITITKASGDGTPLKWNIKSGIDGAPFPEITWAATNTFSVPNVVDGPPRAVYFPVEIEVWSPSYTQIIECDAFVWHSEDSGGGVPPWVDIGNGSRIIYTLPTAVESQKTMDVTFQVVDAEKKPLSGNFSVTVGDSPDDTQASHAEGNLDEAGRIILSPVVNKAPGTMTRLYCSYQGTRYEVTTLTVY
ncbi:MAG: PKD domain-containing protein [bacterium]